MYRLSCLVEFLLRGGGGGAADRQKPSKHLSRQVYAKYTGKYAYCSTAATDCCIMYFEVLYDMS